MSESRHKAEAPDAPLAVEVAELTDVGRARKENQDAIGSVQVGDHWLCILCDGMGGHAGGRTASRLAVDVIKEALFEGFLDEDQAEDAEVSPRERIENAIAAANRRIFEKAKRDASLKGMGTTAVVLHVDARLRTAHVAHVGDSRAYLARGNRFERLTRDHTVVQQLLDEGLLTGEQAADHPHGHVISRSLGSGKAVEVDHLEAPIDLQDGDIFVLCSDGLTKGASDHDIAEIVWGNKPPAAAAALVALANAASGEDNVSVQVVLVGERPPTPEEITLVEPKPRPGHLLKSLRKREQPRGRATPAGESGAADEASERPEPADDSSEAASRPAASQGSVADAGGARADPGQAAQAGADGPLLPALVLGLFIGMIAFLAVYLAVDNRAAEPPPAAAPAGEAEESGHEGED